MYQLDENSQSRYEHFLQHSTEKVDCEAAILRLCVERAMRENRPALVKSLCDSLVKVAAVSQAVKVKEGLMLERDTALRLMKGLVDAVCGVLREFAIPQYEQVVDRIAGDVDKVFEETLRAKERPLCLPAPQTERDETDSVP